MFKRGEWVEDVEGTGRDDKSIIVCIREGKYYKFLGNHEGVKREDSLSLKYAGRLYMRGVSVICPSGCKRLTSLPCLLHLPIAELRVMDRDEFVQSWWIMGQNTPCARRKLLYLPREKGGRGL